MNFVKLPEVRRMVLGILLMGVGSSDVLGQSVPVTQIEDAPVRYARDFTDLRAFRPLSDGRAIAIEGSLGEVLLLSADGREATSVGTKGQGPNEYMDPATLLPLGDSDWTVLVDSGMQRLLVVDPSGQIVVTEAWSLPVGVVPQARDAASTFYYDQSGLVRMDPAGDVIEGPAPLLRFAPGGRPDTLAFVQVYDLANRWAGSPVSRMFSPGPNGVARFRLDRSAFGAQDQWAIAPDGQLVVVYVDPYRVEILDPSTGNTVGGEVVQVERIPVTRADREAFVLGMGRGQSNTPMSFTSPDGARRGMSTPRVEADDLYFPSEKPPFPWGALHVAPAGQILVQRSVEVDALLTPVDVFDSTGTLTHRLELPGIRDLVGAGSRTVFTVRYDEFDVQILERFDVGAVLRVN